MGRAIPICCGVKKNGQPCQFRGRHDGYCKFHLPHTKSETIGDCPICYEKMTSSNMIKTSCKHEFHRSCLERWMEENPSCPMCRTDIRPTTGQLRPRRATSLQESALSSQHVNNGNSFFVTYLDDLERQGVDLATIRNAPVLIHFNGSYWVEQ